MITIDQIEAQALASADNQSARHGELYVCKDGTEPFEYYRVEGIGSYEPITRDQAAAMLAMSANATALKQYCKAHSKPSASCDGKRAVFINWLAMAEAIGLPDAGTDSTRTILAAMDELHAAGILSHFDHGPGTFGHTSTIYNG